VFRAAKGVEFTGGFPGYLDGSAGLMQQVQGIIDHAFELGVYVIVDFHSHQAQDLRAEARAFFAAIAERYGELPNVIYEPYNEPDREAWVTEIKPYTRDGDRDHPVHRSGQRDRRRDRALVAAAERGRPGPDRASNLLYTAHFYACEHGPGCATTWTPRAPRGWACS
jgi:endoglucanase